VHIAGGGELGRLGESISATIATLREIIGSVEASFLIIERVAADLAGLAEAVTTGADREEQVVGVLSGTTAALSGTADRVSGETDVLRKSTEKNLSSLLELSRSVGVVAGNAENLAAAADGTMGAIHEMSASLTQVEQRVADLTRLLRETATAMQLIDQAVGQVKDLSFRSRSVAGGLHRRASEEGREAMARAGEGMAAIKALVASLGERVRSVGRRSEEIDAIVGIVEDISDRTNLLALNAAILAAQAGEHGHGFAVVAEEVRSLSRQTDEALGRISKLIAGVQEDSRAAVGEAARGIEEVERGARQVGGVGAVLEHLVAGAEESSSLSVQIAERADRQAAQSAQVTGAIVEVSAMAEQLLRAAGEQKETSRHILGIAEDTGAKALQMKRSTEEQLGTVTFLEGEAEGAAALGGRLLEGAESSRAAVGEVRGSMRVIAAAVEENRSRARALHDAIDRLGAQAGKVRERLSVFRLRAETTGNAPQ
jgi:methyl-accepting chemotaxis protein